MTGPKRVYPEGSTLRDVLWQRFAQAATAHPSAATRDRARTLAAAISAGQAVTVTVDELKDAAWHAGLMNAQDRHELHNAAAAAGTTEYTVQPDSTCEPV
jgi:hypothetical protein